MNGIYVGYLTGTAGTSVIMLVILNGTISGADVGGLRYDGTIQETPQGFSGNLVYQIPPGASLITGAYPSSKSERIPLTLSLPNPFWDGRTVRVETPLGPINAKFEKLRDL